MVISGEVGIRKPAPEIYALGAERIGLEPEACVFVDDLAFNLEPAAELGMATVHHRTAEETIAELERLLGVDAAMSAPDTRRLSASGCSPPSAHRLRWQAEPRHRSCSRARRLACALASVPVRTRHGHRARPRLTAKSVGQRRRSPGESGQTSPRMSPPSTGHSCPTVSPLSGTLNLLCFDAASDPPSTVALPYCTLGGG